MSPEVDRGPDAFDAVTGRLARDGVAFAVRAHADVGGPIRSPADFAAALGYDVSRIVKTLFVVDKSDRSRSALAAIPADARLDFKATARVLGWSKAETGTGPELVDSLGYPTYGVAPVAPRAAGDAPQVRVVLDEGILAWPTILIGSGRVGVELEVDPDDLLGMPDVLRATIVKGTGT